MNRISIKKHKNNFRNKSPIQSSSHKSNNRNKDDKIPFINNKPVPFHFLRKIKSANIKF